MDSRSSSAPSLATAIAVILAILGFTSAGMWLTRQPGPPAEPPRVAPRSTSTPPTVEQPKRDEVHPSAFLRPLALLATAIGPEPLFSPQAAADPKLTKPYRLATEKQTPDPCLINSQDSSPSDAAPFTEGRVTPGECAIVAALRNRASAQHISVGIIVATLPDWIDSALGWMADPMLDAIQGAAAQMGYSLSGFDLVDTEPSPEDIRPKGSVWPFPKVHESTPAALLFRQESADRQASADPRGPTLLLVLVVGEAATSGIHPAAMATALDIALEWQRPVRGKKETSWWLDDSVRILGPTYSGSAASLQLALKEAAARHHLPTRDHEWFKLVTGSASSSTNRQVLGSELGGLATFASTARSDPDELSALVRYLGRTNRAWQCGSHVGLLVEANTTWGGQLVSVSGSQNCSACLDNPDGYRGHPLPCATVAHFPLHISRLRAAAQSSQAAAASPLGPRSTVAIDLAESLPPTDQIPPETPKLTAATVETLMSALFGVLRDSDVSAIGIFATDKRDHIYLAQEIARHRPNIQPFTLESSQLYLHPDVSGFVRGTIIASTYPLNPRTQSLTQLGGPPSSQQFGSSPAQGVFNALTMLMERPEELIDYREPYVSSERHLHVRADCARTGCAPPIWLSVVSRDALLPLAIDASGRCREGTAPADDAYVECTRVPTGTGISASPYLNARHFRLVLVGILVALIVTSRVVLQYWIDERADALDNKPRSRRKWTSALGSWWLQLAPSKVSCAVSGFETEHLAAVTAIRGATLAILLWGLKMGFGYLCDAWGVPLRDGQVLYGVLSVIALVYLIRQVLMSFWPESPSGVAYRRGRVAVLVFTLATLVAIASAKFPVRVPMLIPACVLAVLAAVFAVFSDARPTTTSRPEKLLAHWRRFPALLGVGAVAALSLDLCIDHWQGIEALFYVDRSLDIDSFVSPGAAIVLLCLSLLWWGMWNLHRIYLLALPETTVGIGPLLDQAALQAAIPRYAAFRSPTQVVGWPLVPLAVAIALALVYGRSYVGSVDGFAFGAFLLLGPLCIIAVMGHTLAHSGLLGGDVVRLLRSLARHPAADVFQAVGKAPFPWGITFDEPRFPQLEPLVNSIERAAQLLSAAKSTAANVPAWFDKLSQLATTEVSALRDRHRYEIGRFALRREDWRTIDRIMRHFARALRATRWRADFDLAACPAPLVAPLREMEFAVGFHAALILRALLTRLISGFTVAFGGLLLLLFAHLLYSFQGRVYWLSLDAVFIAAAAVLAVWLLIILERDTVMSNIWRTTPGRISLFGGLTWRMAGYVVISLATLLVVFFPELTGRTGNLLVSASTALE